MPHKEDRLILPIVPGLCIVCGIFLNKFKKYGIFIFIFVLLITGFSLYSEFSDTYKKSYTEKNICFFKENSFIKNLNSNSLVITDQSPIVYFYARKTTHFYPNPWSLEAFKGLIDNYPGEREVYALFSPNEVYSDKDTKIIQADLESVSEKVFNCSDGGGVYKISF
jgi:hypothetical protein